MSDSASEISSSRAPHEHDPYAALRYGDFRLFLIGNVVAVLGLQMQTVAVGWEVWKRTNMALALGSIGLALILPIFLLALVTGHVADQFNRKWIMMLALATMALGSIGLVIVSLTDAHVFWIYICLLLSGIARAFHQPAKSAMMPQTVDRKHFSNAVTWSTGGFHLASVLGPALAGLLLSSFESAVPVYAFDAAAALFFCLLLLRIRSRPVAAPRQAFTLDNLAGGFAFVKQNKIILAAITLDMLAVLLGGATTLLPIYADEILQVGPAGLGWMRAAPAAGAVVMAFVLAYRPPMQHAGRALLWSVVGFGTATIVFGVSRSFWLSLVALFLTGAFDNISVVIRHTLVQVLTPDAMRGRVSAVNGLFIGASNELGGFESGLVAQFFGSTFSVVSGGIGTLLVVASTALAWPQLRRYGRLDSSDAAQLGPADHQQEEELTSTQPDPAKPHAAVDPA